MAARLAIIVLNYRTPELTLACVRSLADQANPERPVMVVDNDSQDGSDDQIEEEIRDRGWSHWCRVVRAPTNGGFAYGNNLGIRSVDAGTYVLLNSDTVVRPGALDALEVALDAHPRAGLVGPSFEDERGELETSSFRFPTPLSEFVRAAQTGPITRALKGYDVPLSPGRSPTEPDWIGFACVAIRHEVIEEVGLLDEGFFMYFEDADYCRRARDSGWSIVYWPSARVMHLLGGSSGVTSADGVRNRAPPYYFEARSRYFAKHFGRRGLWAANILWSLGHVLAVGRAALGRVPEYRVREAHDIWLNWYHPFRASSFGSRSEASHERKSRPRTSISGAPGLGSAPRR